MEWVGGLMYRLCRCKSKRKSNDLKEGSAPPSFLSSMTLPLSWPFFAFDIPSDLSSYHALLRPPLPQNYLGPSVRLPVASAAFPIPELLQVCIRCWDANHPWILALGLTKRSVAVGWSWCAGLCGSVAVGQFLWVSCCKSVALSWSL